MTICISSVIASSVEGSLIVPLHPLLNKGEREGRLTGCGETATGVYHYTYIMGREKKIADNSLATALILTLYMDVMILG